MSEGLELYDLLIKGGTVVDTALGLNDVCDVAIADGKIAVIEDCVDGEAREVIDAAGLIVTPGLIDMHMHAYWGVCCYGLDPDAINIARGVTTAMDCGSAGARTFPHFRRTVMERVRHAALRPAQHLRHGDNLARNRRALRHALGAGGRRRRDGTPKSAT